MLRSIIFASVILSSSLLHAEDIAGRVRVVDGDTIDVGETRVRLFGIDAPEITQRCKTSYSSNVQCGRQAVLVLESLIQFKHVKCNTEAPHDDGRGRKIAKCYLGNLDIGAELIRRSLAWAFRKYRTDYIPLEEKTKRQLKGIWEVPNQTPWDFRAERWMVSEQKSPNGCPIKGNVNSRGEKIYHTPWTSPWYDKTRVSIEKGERWFCDEADAIKAGWRAPRWSG